MTRVVFHPNAVSIAISLLVFCGGRALAQDVSYRDRATFNPAAGVLLEDFDGFADGAPIDQLFAGLVTFDAPLPSIFFGGWDNFGTGGEFSGGGLLPEPLFQSAPLTLNFSQPVFGVGANAFDDFDGTPIVAVITLTVTTTSGATISVSEDFSNFGDTGFLGVTSTAGIVRAVFSISNTGGNLEIDKLTVIADSPCTPEDPLTYRDRATFNPAAGVLLEDFDGFADGAPIDQLFAGLVTFDAPLPSIFFGGWDNFGTGGEFSGGGLLPEPLFQSAPLTLNFSQPVFGVGANAFDDFDGTPIVAVITLTVTTTSGATISVSEDFSNFGDTGFLGVTSTAGIVRAVFSISNTGGNLEIDKLTVIADCTSAIDSDGDGVPDDSDNCPAVANPLQEDFDSDGFGDVCDPDDDNDGVDDTVDNCPIEFNPDQVDADLDGLGDACDPTFETGTILALLQQLIAEAVQQITSANPPGGNGMIAKLTGNGGVLRKVCDAVAAFEAGGIDTATYIDQLNDALAKLDAFDNQLAAKINNGQIVNPEASELVQLTAAIRVIINALIANAI